MSDVKDISAEEFDREVKGSGSPAVLEFWVRSCDQCRKFKPVYETLPEVFGGRIRFLRMNMFKSMENLRLAEDLGVEQTPTTKVYCSGGEVGTIVGYLPLEEAEKTISELLRDCES